MASRELTVTFVGDARPLQKAMKDVQEGASGLGKHLGDVAKIAGGFVVAQGLMALPGVLTDIAGKARQLELEAKKVAIVFGPEGAKDIKAWADGASGAMGMTSSKAQAMAASLQDLLVPMGFTREAAMEITKSTLDLSGALSNWSGGQKSAAEVADLLAKAYLGETDGLKALGIAISAAEIDQRLLAKGQKELTGEALNQAKALATQELIMEKSTDAQKAWAEGGREAAEKQKALGVTISQLKEDLATKLGPALQSITVFMGQLATNALPVVSAAFEKIGPIVQTVASALGNAFGFVIDNSELFIAAAAGISSAILVSLIPATLAWIAAEWAKVAALTASAAAFVAANLPLIAIAAAIGLVVAGVILLVRHWDEITAKFPILGTAVDGVKAGLMAFVSWITGPFVEGVGKIYDAVKSAIDKAIGFVKEHWGTITAIFGPPIEAIVTVVETQFALVKVAFETAFGVIRGIFNVFAGLFTGDWGRMKDGLMTVVNSLKDGAIAAINAMITGISGLAGLAWTAMKNLGEEMLNGLKAALSATGGFASDVGQAVLEAVKSVVNSLIDSINSKLRFTIDLPFGQSFTVDAPDIRPLAAGGIVTRPTLALIGEAGPEAVIPLSRARADASLGGVTIHNHFHGFVGDVDQLTREIDLTLKRQGQPGLVTAG